MALDCWQQNACGLRVNISDVVDPAFEAISVRFIKRSIKLSKRRVDVAEY